MDGWLEAPSPNAQCATAPLPTTHTLADKSGPWNQSQGTDVPHRGPTGQLHFRGTQESAGTAGTPVTLSFGQEAQIISMQEKHREIQRRGGHRHTQGWGTPCPGLGSGEAVPLTLQPLLGPCTVHTPRGGDQRHGLQRQIKEPS